MQVGVYPTLRHLNSQLTKALLSQALVINGGWGENNCGLRLPDWCPLLWPSQSLSLFRPLWAFLFHIMLDWVFTSSLSAHCLFHLLTQLLLSVFLSLFLSCIFRKYKEMPAGHTLQFHRGSLYSILSIYSLMSYSHSTTYTRTSNWSTVFFFYPGFSLVHQYIQHFNEVSGNKTGEMRAVLFSGRQI